MSDLTTFARDLAADTKAYVADYVAKAIGGLVDDLKELRDRLATVRDGVQGPAGEKGEPGRDGKDAEPVDLMLVAQRAADLIPRPKDGRDGRDVDVMALKAEIASAVAAVNLSALVRDEVARVCAAIPKPADGKDGKDADMLAIKALVDAAVPPMRDVSGLVREAVAAAVEHIPVPQDGRDGKDADPEFIKTELAKAVAAIEVKHGRDGRDADPALIVAEVQKAVTQIPVPKDGKDGVSIDPTVVDVMVAAQVERAVKSLPVPKDGASVTVADVEPLIKAEVDKAVKAIPVPKDGRDGVSVDPRHVDALVRTHVEKAVAAIPVPVDGKSLTPEDVAPLISAEVSKAVKDIPPPRDGVGIVGALIDRDGRLILTLSDGSTKDVGVVTGKDVDPADVARLIHDEVAQIPRPKDGIDGKNGLGFDDMDLAFDQQRGWLLRLMRGDQVKDFPISVPWDAGTFEQGRVYPKGAGVSRRGFWIAQEDTAATPGDTSPASRAWRLVVKPGRDGKDGRPGRDLT